MSDPHSEPLVLREHLLQTLEATLGGETRTLVLEGVEGIGKSTLLRQFRTRYADRTFGLFLAVDSRWAYDPLQVTLELCGQLSQRLRGRELDQDVVVDDRLLGKLLGDADRQARRDKLIYFFILDGLEDIPQEERGTVQQLLALMPFGFPTFRFLLSGDIQRLPLNPAVLRTAKSYPVALFSRPESDRYMEGLSLSDTQLEEIHRATKGVPGKLASIRRRLLSSGDPNTVLHALPEHLSDLFALEWQVVDEHNEQLTTLLAVLAHEGGAHSVQDLSALTGQACDGIISTLEKLSFIRMEADARVCYESAAFQRFAAKRLSSRKMQVTDLYINFLQRDPDSQAALTQLPSLLSLAQRYGDVVQYLSAQRFARLYQHTPSLGLVKQIADEGVAAARALGRVGDQVRFLLQRCVIDEIAQSDIRVSEVRARAAVNDVESALAIANGTTRPEQRFRLLAAIARVQRGRGVPEDPELTSQLRALYTQLDPKVFGDRVPEVASDLFATAPELAIEMVSAIGAEGGENAMDWALLRLSIEARVGAPNQGLSEHARTISERIQNPAARKLSTDAAVILGRMSAEAAIQEADKLESTGDKLYVLQHWMGANRADPEAIKVLEHGVRLALQATGYSATAATFRQLAVCLPYVKEWHKLSYYIGILDAQQEVLRKTGPDEEFFRLQILLARAEFRHDRLTAQKRFNEIYNEISAVRDPSVRTAAMARLSASLSRTDPEHFLEIDGGLHTLADQDLTDGIDSLLKVTADHFEAMRGVIQALAFARPEAALTVAAKLNTENRRDEAYQEFVETAGTAPIAELPFDSIVSAMDRIVDRDIYSACVSEFVESTRRSKLRIADARRLLPLVERIGAIDGAGTRAEASAQLLSALEEVRTVTAPEADEAVSSAIERLRDVAEAAWEAIDPDWQKLELGLEIVVAAARSAPAFAHGFVERVNTLKHALLLPDAESSTTAQLQLRLASRAYEGLVKRNLDRPEDFERLLRAIGRLGSAANQVIVLVDVALRLHLNARQAECADVVQRKLVPLLQSLPPEDAGLRHALLVFAWPAVHAGAAGTAAALLATLPPVARDEAIWQMCWFVLQHVPIGEPFESSPKGGYDLSFENANQLVSLIGEMQNDAWSYAMIRRIVESVGGARRDKLKRAQRAELARALDELIAEKFPNQRFIRHRGFGIIAEAQVTKLLDQDNSAALRSLATEARALPNMVDRAYVMSILAGLTQSSRDRVSLLKEAREIADSVPMLADRIDLYESMSGYIGDIDGEQGKELLKEALSLAFQGEGESLDERRKSVLNAACRHYPELASSFASTSDDDPARQRVERTLRLQKLNETLAKRRPPKESLEVRDKFDWSRATWLNLGSLNAGRSAPIPIERATATLEFASGQELSRSYPIFAWFIANAGKLPQGTERARPLLLGLFEASLLGFDMSIMTSERPGGQAERLIDFGLSHTGSFQGAQVYEDGERDLGLQDIRKWLQEVSPTRLWIVEPYFGIGSIAALALVRDLPEDCQVTLLASSEESLRKVAAPEDAAYRGAWERLRSDEPPETTLIFAGTKGSGKFPVHDRWWLCTAGGLHLGTSYGGIGSRLSGIRRIDAFEAAAVMTKLEPFFLQTRREFEGDRLLYRSFTL